jgi:hypothetical protein
MFCQIFEAKKNLAKSPFAQLDYTVFKRKASALHWSGGLLSRDGAPAAVSRLLAIQITQ